MDVREGTDGHSGDGPVPPWCWHTMTRLPSPPPRCCPRWDVCSGPRERGGGQRVSGQRWRKQAVTTSCSGFKRKRLAAAGCFPQPPAGSFPLSLDGGSHRFAGWWVLSLGGCQALVARLVCPWSFTLPDGLHGRDVPRHERLAWMFAPNPVPNPLGCTSQGLFSSKEIRPGSRGPPRTRGLPACRQ